MEVDDVCRDVPVIADQNTGQKNRGIGIFYFARNRE